jgi:hypothetical protein
LSYLTKFTFEQEIKKINLINWTSKKKDVTLAINAFNQVDQFLGQNGQGNQVGWLEKPWFIKVSQESNKIHYIVGTSTFKSL